ncbi:hypothetical protein Clacol_006459 [Clathrus columnatus]|uniref:Nucleolar complex-associated protein 3 n=1 Tax=Clathrus columnatus TaxID=1419009 RepID=A0AAV5AGG1_9AGAM|nr:hypothetical protein Clacol_006459 [Clathrus columnatus]
MSKVRPAAKQNVTPVLLSDDEISDLDSLSETDSTGSHMINDEEFQSDILEQAYESKSQIATTTKQEGTIPKLPIKLSDGRIVKTGNHIVPEGNQSDEDLSDYSDTENSFHASHQVEDVATGARFGRPAVTAVLDISSAPLRIQTAKEEIAKICQDILADPENSLGLLRRLHSFALRHVSSINNPQAVENDPLIRRLAMISELAVLKDIIPGYRIRPLTDAEKKEKMLEMCSKTLITVFRADQDGTVSLEIVRMMNRMIKERHFMIHPNVLSCLLHLRLKSDLNGVRASETKAEKEDQKGMSLSKVDRKRAKGKKVAQPHLSKKTRKVIKERKEIEEQLRDAEAEIDQEDKANMQTETLKLLFVLYFRILKLPTWSPLLCPALEGISRHAHMVNIDFFKDLMDVLKNLISRSSETHTNQNLSVESILQYKLLCVVTAFELLMGQGEALNIDLKDFYFHLYNLIIPVSLTTPPPQATGRPMIDTLFKGLGLAFPARSTGARTPTRAAAFAKRLLSACLLFPPSGVMKTLKFIEGLISNEPKLMALFSTDDRNVNGLYRPDIDEPELCNPFATSFWELTYLANAYQDKDIRRKAQMILDLNV